MRHVNKSMLFGAIAPGLADARRKLKRYAAISRRGLFIAPLAVPCLWIVWTVVTTDWPSHEYVVFAAIVLVIGYFSALIVGGVMLSITRVLGLNSEGAIVGAGAFGGAVVLQAIPAISGGLDALNLKTIILGAALGAFTAGVYCWLGRITRP